MVARIAVMEQLIEKLTNKKGVLREENKTLKDNIQEPVHDEEPTLVNTMGLDMWRETTTNKKKGRTCRTNCATSKGNIRR